MATARSGSESPLKSPTATEKGPSPAATVGARQSSRRRRPAAPTRCRRPSWRPPGRDPSRRRSRRPRPRRGTSPAAKLVGPAKLTCASAAAGSASVTASAPATTIAARARGHRATGPTTAIASTPAHTQAHTRSGITPSTRRETMTALADRDPTRTRTPPILPARSHKVNARTPHTTSQHDARAVHGNTVRSGANRPYLRSRPPGTPAIAATSGSRGRWC